MLEKVILKNFKRRKYKPAIDWINFKKASTSFMNTEDIGDSRGVRKNHEINGEKHEEVDYNARM